MCCDISLFQFIIMYALYSGQNARPQITNLPLTENQPESITDADILFTLTIDDTAYAGQAITVRFDCTPSEWENIFELDGKRM